MTLEEKAYEYAKMCSVDMEGYEAIRQAYLAGATEAMESQWHTSNEIPPGTTLLLCQCRREDVATALCVYIKNRFMIYDGKFKYDKEFFPTHWMPIPPVKGGEA